jgi:hypothetical protein
MNTQRFGSLSLGRLKFNNLYGDLKYWKLTKNSTGLVALFKTNGE